MYPNLSQSGKRVSVIIACGYQTSVELQKNTLTLTAGKQRMPHQTINSIYHTQGVASMTQKIKIQPHITKVVLAALQASSKQFAPATLQT